jgi:hypothetical protein
VLAVLAKIIFDEPPKLRRVRPEMPEAVEALLGRMLAKEKAARLPDARAVLEALDALDCLALSDTFSSGDEAPHSRLVDAEQHLVSVLMATPLSGAVPGSPASTIVDMQLAELHRELTVLGAKLELLADGSLVATLSRGRGAATDQAAQAAQCALLIKARWPEATIALSTGRGLLQERLPIGEVLDRAAALLRDRPASESPSGLILLDEVTSSLLDMRYRIERTPSGRYALSGEELDLDASRPLLGKPTPCVGRDVELGVLESELAGCIEDGESRALLVTGPPGAGKSRLMHELLRRVRARAEDVLILIGRGDPLSAGSSYSLLGQALRRLCGILDGESLLLRRTKLAQRIGERIGAAERERVTAFVGELASVPFPDQDNVKLRAARQDPQIMSDQSTQAVLEFLRAECAARPVLLVLEDLHWGDALTIKLCEIALRELKDHPLMMLGLARPEVHELFPRLWSGAAKVIPLRPLSKKARERLMERVLGRHVAPDMATRIVEQSEGNALFLEELIRAVAEGRGNEAPETVLAMLQARIGRLEVGGRRVLRAASVYGRTSWLGGIRALLGGAMSDQEIETWLTRLTKDEILEERRESRFPGEREVRFRHALMRDAAYGLLTAEDRALAHRIAGEHLAASGEHDALVLAEHFVQGKAPARAIPYYLQAAEQSYEANDMDAAFASAERGLCCGAEGEQRGAFLSVQVAVYLGRQKYEEIISLALKALDLLPPGSKQWCRAAHFVFPAALYLQQTSLFAELTAQFARVEPSADARGEYVRAAAWLASGLATMGQRNAMRIFLRRAQQIGAKIERSDIVSWAYMKAAEAIDHSAIEEAPWSRTRCHAEARDALRTAGEQRMRCIFSSLYGVELWQLGDAAGAEAEIRATLTETERLNEPFPLNLVKVTLARVLAPSAPLDCLDEPIRLANDVIAGGSVIASGSAHAVLAEIKRRQDDLPGAEMAARAACEAMRSSPAYLWEIIALQSRILLEQGRVEEALAIAEDGVQELERLGLAGYGELALRLSLVEARHAAGQVKAARALLMDAIQHLQKRLTDIPEAAARERYLTKVPVNAQLVALAKEWLGVDVRA